ncbi:hypothetical protein YC2023_018041 [Brassica napus]
MTMNVRLIIGSNGSSLALWMLWPKVCSSLGHSIMTLILIVIHFKPQSLKVSMLLFFSFLLAISLSNATMSSTLETRLDEPLLLKFIHLKCKGRGRRRISNKIKEK